MISNTLYVKHAVIMNSESTVLNSTTKLTVSKHVVWVVVALSGSCPPWTQFMLVGTCRATLAATFRAIRQHVVRVISTLAN